MKTIIIPPTIRQALESGAAIAVGISGGKDSQALAKRVKEAHTANGWQGDIFAIHADLGRAEWPQTGDHVRAIAEENGMELVIVQYKGGDMVDRLWNRLDKLKGTGKPFWPSSAARYCTSDLKRGPIDKYLRQYDCIISAEGIRSDESASRCAKPVFAIRKQIKTQTRDAFTWNPIKEYTIDDVWESCGMSTEEIEHRRDFYRRGMMTWAFHGSKVHPAYIMGNERLSCALCVLGSTNDLQNGAQHNPELLEEYIKMQDESGFLFRQNLDLRTLRKESAQ